MNFWTRLLWSFIGPVVKQQLAHEAKRRGVLVYLRALQTVRLSLVGFVAVMIFFQLTTLFAFGALVTGFLIWDHDFAEKMQILFGVFLGGFLVLLTLTLIGLSQWFWYRASGAKKMVDSL